MTISSILRLRLGLCVLLALSTPACSVFMAANQPPRKDLSILTAGTPRADVTERLGQPLKSRLLGNVRVDLYSIIQGYSKEARAARAFGHGVGDIATLGLWEIAGTSAETHFDGKKISFEITYDAQDRIERVTRLNE